MTTEEILILAGVVVLVLVVLGLAAWAFSSRRNKRHERLRERYGREYDATVDAKGQREGEADLANREEERRELELRDPGEDVRGDLRHRMAELQFRFVEDPQEVLLETQRVVTDGLRARGYPIAEDRDRALRLLSVDHPEETPPLRALLGGSYGRDMDSQRRLFLDARSALMAVVDVSYTQRDLGTGSGDTLERGRGHLADDDRGLDRDDARDRDYARDLDRDDGRDHDRGYARGLDHDDTGARSRDPGPRDGFDREPRPHAGGRGGANRVDDVPPPPARSGHATNGGEPRHEGERRG